LSSENEREIVTQEDVAREAGVSRAIVSYVLNNGPRKVSDETRTRVLTAIRELGYRPNKYAQRLKLGADAAQNSIGIVAGGKGYNLLERPYYSVILASLFDRAHHLNQHIRFFTFFEALEDPVFFNKNVHREEISSLILLLPASILEHPQHANIMPQIIERIDNIICLERSIYGLPALVFDVAAAAQLAVEHLIGLGHRRIGFLSLSDERLDGYKRTLGMHNIPFDESLMRVVDGGHILSTAYDCAVSLLKAHPDMTALFASNDEGAIAAMAAIQDCGMKVPDDIAIASVDDTEFARMVRPALTTVNVPRQEMVDYALHFLISQREHPVSSPASMILPLELIVRESSGGKR
jgi:DNA-binding LacI/PurR family transcriptional regulator